MRVCVCVRGETIVVGAGDASAVNHSLRASRPARNGSRAVTATRGRHHTSTRDMRSSVSVCGLAC